MSVKIRQGKVNAELHIEGKFVAGWEKFDMPEEILATVESMLDEAYSAGKRAAKKEIAKILGENINF